MNIYLVRTTSNTVYAVISNQGTEQEGRALPTRRFMLKDAELTANDGSGTFTLTNKVGHPSQEAVTFAVADITKASCVPILAGTTLATLYAEMIEEFLLTDTSNSANTIPFTDATRPAAPLSGKLYYNNDSGKFEYWNGTVWNTTSLAATTILPIPASITPTEGDGEISSAFALSAGGTNYTAQASADDFATIAGVNTGSGSPIVIDGLTNGVSYKTRVRAEAVGKVWSGWRTSTAVIPDTP